MLAKRLSVRCLCVLALVLNACGLEVSGEGAPPGDSPAPASTDAQPPSASSNPGVALGSVSLEEDGGVPEGEAAALVPGADSGSLEGADDAGAATDAGAPRPKPPHRRAAREAGQGAVESSPSLAP